MAARETWQREACIAAGGRSCLNENIESKYKMSRWSFQSEVFFHAPAGGTATPLPGTGEHVMNLKRKSRILEFQVLVELSIITYQFFHGKAALDLTRDSSAPGELIGKCLTICIICLLEFHLTACSSSWAAAAICPLSLFSIFCRFSRHPTIFCRVQGVMMENAKIRSKDI